MLSILSSGWPTRVKISRVAQEESRSGGGFSRCLGMLAAAQRLRTIPRIVVATALLSLPAFSAHAQQVDQKLWGVDPNVNLTAVAVSGQTLYVGGSFLYVSPVIGGGAITDRITGALRHDSPRVAGSVFVCIPDGRSGWFIGGDFAGVGGQPRRNVAHIFGDGRVDAWAPNPDGEVDALALSGQTLYVGGVFTAVDGEHRDNLAAVDVESGRVTAWNPGVGNFVRTLLVLKDRVYVGGVFPTVGGQPRRNLASVDVTTGQVTSWDPEPDDDVFTLAAHGDTLFAGGRFYGLAEGAVRPRLAAFDIRTGALLDWNANVDRTPPYRYDCGPCVTAMLVDGDQLYIAGGFNRIGGAVRPGLAAVDLHTAAVLGWDPHVTTPPDAGPAEMDGIALRGTTIYVAGLCDSLGGQRYRWAGAVDTRTAQALPWDPQPNFGVFCLAASGDAVYVGGTFTSAGPTVARQGLAAFDLRTGRVTPWDPGIDGLTYTMAVRDGAVYVGGSFGFVGGQARAGLAALDQATGKATSWDPNSAGPVWSLALAETTAYVGGLFGRIGGQARSFLAEVDLRTGLATPWAPEPNDLVTSVLVSHNIVYVGGWFTALGISGRARIAALDRRTGLPTAWDPQADVLVNCMAVDDTTVYVGGYFNHIGGQARDGFAAVSALTGAATPMTANVDQDVKQLAVQDGVVYVGGAFQSIGGVTRFYLAALEPGTGRVLDWNPDPDGVVWGMTADANGVYPVGSFARMGVTPVSLMAAVSHATAAPGPGPIAGLPQLQFIGVTNPCRSSGVVHFVLQNAASVNLDVFDMQGRQVRRVLEQSPQAAGEHEIPVDTNGWAPGFYFWRLSGGSDRATRKMVVLP